MSLTIDQYDEVVSACQEIFFKKAKDYGTSWRVYRQLSVVDQLYIKAWRIRQIQEGVIPLIEDDKKSEFKAIVNYGIIGLILMNNTISIDNEIELSTLQQMYNKEIEAVKNLMLSKNNDYGEAWRNMSQESFVDLILTKLLRIKQILRNDGVTIISEGIDANYADIINYAIFALILIDEKKH